MTPKEKEQQLQRENAQLREQVEGLKKRLEEMEAKKKPSRTRQQAEEGLKMLQSGPVSMEQFKTLNEKYPSDVPYYIRNVLKIDVKTVRVPGKGSLYMLPEHYAIYQEGLAKEKAAQEKAKAEAKEAKERASGTPGAAAAPKEAAQQQVAA